MFSVTVDSLASLAVLEVIFLVFEEVVIIGISVLVAWGCTVVLQLFEELERVLVVPEVATVDRESSVDEFDALEDGVQEVLNWLLLLDTDNRLVEFSVVDVTSLIIDDEVEVTSLGASDGVVILELQ